jgi:hypothetical protein
LAKWRPLNRRDDESYDALHEGVPAWLVGSLWDFVEMELTYKPANIGGRLPDRGKLKEVERKLRVGLDWSQDGRSALNNVRYNVGDGDYFLNLVDLLLSGITKKYEAQEVDQHLAEAGSAWTVDLAGDGPFRLLRRVDPTVTAAARAVINSAGRAGQHLAKAWNEVYGRNPDPSTAYREAVRAVEAVGAPVISPNNPKATLGTMIADMRNDPTKWVVVLTPSAGDPVLMFRETMQLLWTAELSRHGTADESVPLHVSPSEAEAALHLAVTLVHWFHSGAIKAKA